LGNSLRNAPKARGRWGEQQLRNVLEQCGLAEHTDFVTEHSIDTEDGRLRPDAIVNIPGHKKLVIDAKVSLNAYQEAFEAQDEAARELALAAHVASMRNHVQTLGTKSYQSQFEDAPDYVVMFVPGSILWRRRWRKILSFGILLFEIKFCWRLLLIWWRLRAPWRKCGGRMVWHERRGRSGGWGANCMIALLWPQSI